MKNKKKHKIECSKLLSGLVIVTFGLYGVWCGIKYYSLAKLAIENNTVMPDPILAVTCVTTVIAALLSYCLYNGFLKNSLNIIIYSISFNPQNNLTELLFFFFTNRTLKLKEIKGFFSFLFSFPVF